MLWQKIEVLSAALGEGLHWDGRQGCLWRIDIHGCELLRWSPVEGGWQSWHMTQRVGWVLPHVDDGTVLLGLQGGFARAPLQPEPGLEPAVDWVARPFDGRAALRLNDAKADSTGAVWAGSTNNDDESRSDGCLFRLSPDGQLEVVDTGYMVANGPAISPDESLMLHTDSGRRTIYAFDLNVQAGKITNRRVWKQFTGSEGYPDGMCFDAEGCVWMAHWGAGCVSRFALDGALLQRISLPTSNITNVCFGGPGLDRLFVSSARAGLSQDQLSREPLAGALFECRSRGPWVYLDCRMAGFSAPHLAQEPIIKKSLITGQDGSYLSEFLLDKGCEVHCV